MKGASQLRKLNRFFEEAGFTEEDYITEMENSGVEGAVPISFMIPLEYRLNEDSVDVSIPMAACRRMEAELFSVYNFSDISELPEKKSRDTC